MHARMFGTGRFAILFPPKVLFMLIISVLPVHAFDLSEISGTWTWKSFVIQIAACQDKMCAKVIDGPKNIGMELFASDLNRQGEAWVGEVTDPETSVIYFTRLQLIDSNNLKLDGCTKNKLCLSGNFVRRLK